MNKLTILYENHPNPHDSSLEIGWGLSILIEKDEKKILFDTGWHGNILMRNCQRLGKYLGDIDALIISHPHWDHMGGLPQVIETLKKARLYFPEDYSPNQINEIKRLRPDLSVNINHSFSILDEISPDFALTPSELGDNNIKEHALIIKQPDGSGILIVGCLHPGIKSFIESARSFAPIKFVIGGLHAFKDFALVIENNVTTFAIGHCTKYISDFQNCRQFSTQTLHVGMDFLI